MKIPLVDSGARIGRALCLGPEGTIARQDVSPGEVNTLDERENIRAVVSIPHEITEGITPCRSAEPRG